MPKLFANSATDIDREFRYSSSFIPVKISDSDNSVKGQLADLEGWKVSASRHNRFVQKDHPINLIRKYRELSALTQGQLAERTGCATSTIEKLENGKMALTHGYLSKIAKALKVSQADILGEKENYSDLRDSEIALADTFKDIILLLLSKGIANKEELNFLFNHRRGEYEEKNLGAAVQVVSLLQEFVNDKPLASELQTTLRLLKHAQGGSV